MPLKAAHPPRTAALKKKMDKPWRDSVESFRPRETERERDISRRGGSAWTKLKASKRADSAMVETIHFSFWGRLDSSAVRVMNSPSRSITSAGGAKGRARRQVAALQGLPSRQQAVLNEALDHKRPAMPDRGWHGFRSMALPSTALQSRETRASHSLWST